MFFTDMNFFYKLITKVTACFLKQKKTLKFVNFVKKCNFCGKKAKNV